LDAERRTAHATALDHYGWALALHDHVVDRPHVEPKKRVPGVVRMKTKATAKTARSTGFG
jgi:hypothetical protein